MKRKQYETAMAPMREQLVAMARWARVTGQRIVVLFEGRDTAGKGGAIRAVSEKLNPRQCHIVALAKPTEAEQTQWYFQRYVQHLPSAGEIVLFDRSWYNRAGVEKVMGYAEEPQVSRFLEQAPQFERMLVDDGILLFKYWLTTDQARQEERLRERLDDPLKRWKLSPVDLAARDAGLVGGHRHRPAGLAQPCDRLQRARDGNPLVHGLDVGIGVFVNDPVAVEDNEFVHE